MWVSVGEGQWGGGVRRGSTTAELTNQVEDNHKDDNEDAVEEVK